MHSYLGAWTFANSLDPDILSYFENRIEPDLSAFLRLILLFI